MKNNSTLAEIKRSSGMVLLCLLLGFLAWQGIRKNIGFEILVSDVVVDVNVPAGWAVWEKSVGKVDILFRGSRENIRYLNNDQLRIVVAVDKPEEGGVVTLKLSDQFLKSPTDARGVSFRPPEISVKLDREMEKVVPVKAAVSGVLAEGLEIERITCTPATVSISGAKRLVNKMESVHTKEINLSGRLSSFEESVRLAPPESGRITAPTDWIKVKCTLIERSDQKEIKDVPVRVISASGEDRIIKLSPDKITITVKGRANVINKLANNNLFGYVSSVDLVENTGYDLPARINLPDNVKIIQMDPPVIHLDIKSEKTR